MRYRAAGSRASWTDHSFAGTSTTIDGLTNGQSYRVRVRAVNSVGPGSWSRKRVAEPAAQAPDAPGRPTVNPGNAELEVSWTASSDNGDPINDYNVQYRRDNSGRWIDHEPSSTSTSTSVTITGLTNNQPYQVRVQAVNSIGRSTWSPILIAEPAAQAPDAPGRPTVNPGNAQLEVSWTAPADNGDSIIDYNVQYRQGAGSWLNHKLSHISTSTSATITGLTNGLNYTVQVRATNSAGPSDWSTSATGTPAAQAPDAPGRLTVNPGNAQLEVSWTPPSDNGDSIIDYSVQYRQGAGSWLNHEGLRISTSTSTSTIIDSLTNNQPYQLRVRAVNSAGRSTWSPIATGTPAAQVPDAPGRPTVNPGNAQLVVMWTKPSDNGDPINDYNVEYREGNSGDWSEHASPGTVTGTTIPNLINGQSYQVRVQARSSAGPSDWSPAAASTPNPQRPDAPSALTVNAGDRQLEVSWTAPSINGAPISGYNVQYREGSSGGWSNHASPGTGTGTTIPSLTNGQSYQVQVRATNSAGRSDWSTSATGTPAAQAPDAPGRPRLTPGNAELEVSWTAPSDNGDSIIDYNVQYRQGAGSWLNHELLRISTSTSATITGLTNGLNYTVQVRATNSAGRSDWSTSATGTPAAQAPDAPGRPRLTPGNAELRVTWTAPSDNGDSITRYDVRYRAAGSRASWTDHSFAGTGTSTTIDGLANGQSYRVRVRAVNSVGPGSWSRKRVAEPAAQAPDAPGRPTVNPGNAELEVSWTAPSDNGDSIIDYNVQYRQGAGSWLNHKLLHISTSTSATITGLTNGLNYTVQVRAANSAGPSDWSTSATGTPAAQAPDAPGRLTVTPGNGELEVSWNAPSDNGDSIIDYNVQYRQDAGSWLDHELLRISTSTSATIDSLTNNQPYQVRVRAVNSIGRSTWSPIRIAEPKAEPPDAPGRPTVNPGNAQLEVSWIAPSDNGDSIIDYNVQYRQGAGSWLNHKLLHISTSTSATITGLTNGLNYTVQVRATNSAGPSDWSTSATGTPAAQAPDAPGRLTVNAGDRQLVVSWTAPSDNGDSIIDYSVQYRQGAGSWLNHEGLRISTSTGTSTIIDSLTNGQPYQVRVRAVNSVGPGSWSPIRIAEPKAEPPFAPTTPRLIAGNAQLRVTWTAPSDNGDPINDYNVQYRRGNSGRWIDHEPSSTSTSTSVTITGLINGRGYQVRVQAVNLIDSSDWSDFETGTPTAEPPSAPTAPRLTSGNGELEVSWSMPSINGAAISGYNVEYREGNSGDWSEHASPGTGTGTTIPSLINGQFYQVRVQARSSAGPSDWSPAAASTPNPQRPDAPSALTVNAGDRQLEVSWTAPSINGAPISGYNVQYREGSSGGWSNHASPGTGTGTTIPSLTNGQSYQVRVRATNSAGPSDWSPIATGTPAAQAASAPSALTVNPVGPDSWSRRHAAEPAAQAPSAPSALTVNAGDRQLVVSWTAPSDNGDSIIDYNVQYRQGAGSWLNHELLRISTSTSATITGLTNGHNYTVQVRATNEAGPSDWSTSATGTPAAQAPDAPGRPTVNPGNAELRVTWTAPSDNGDSITRYDVRYRAAGSRASWTDHSFAGTGTSTTIDGLTNGQSYRVRVRAVNSVGPSGWSPRGVAAPAAGPAVAQAPDTPGRPTVNPGNRKLEVSWSAPAENGASISDYDVRYQPTSAINWTNLRFVGVGTITTITGLTNGHNYTVQVRATNSAGRSDWSTSATGTPAAQAPDAPGRPTVNPGNAELEVSWTAPSDNETSISTTAIPNLINGGSYQEQVRLAGRSDWSTSATGTLAAEAPDAPDRPTLTEGNGQLEVEWSAPSDNGDSTSPATTWSTAGATTAAVGAATSF